MTTEQRLERLERQNRSLRRGMIGMALVGLSLLVMGQTLPGKVYNVVKAKRFEVIGDNGRMMIMLTLLEAKHIGSWIDSKTHSSI